ncbi:hypothetical protein K432DRAFT_349001 [Lepidopterella palustris CBS 459.81]|uniref:Uncharacterized protein n=1 Tax=Lepidopterella palustris CBS 459.81 TaxID=1314670 RepID=A0A8E2EEN7_9PEZI|nr:hypothetical protein K432DRAFT_349001 [Lepidopterella palustris CBS 459.81]
MRYIRFLKPPRIEGNNTSNKTLKALITITSDLGDTFLPDNLALAASLRPEGHDGDIYLCKTVQWTAGMRSLPIVFELTNANLDWPVRVHVGVKGNPASDCFGKRHKADPPSIISAWSGVLDALNGVMEAEKMVERRFTPLSGRTLSIWEETGESIARHLWDAGLSLAAHLNRTTALQTTSPTLLLLESTLSRATDAKLRILELGAGTGIVGISLAQTIPDAEILLTDLPAARALIQKNISVMSPAMNSSAAFCVLDWEDESLPRAVGERVWDIVLVADCTYNPDSSPALVRTLAALVKRSPKVIVIVAMKVRHPAEAVFFDLMAAAAFVVGSHTVLNLPGNSETTGEKIDVLVFCDKGRVQVGHPTSPEEASGLPVVSFWED